MDYNQYDNPLITRYASSTMSELFSPQRKFSTWRRLWVALAETEMELGLPITQEQVDELRSQVDNIDFDAAAEYEKKPYLKLGQLSCADVNADLSQCGLAGSPTKVKNVENIVFKAKESKVLTSSDNDINELVKELLANHTIG